MLIEAILPIIQARLSVISRDALFLAAARIFGTGKTRMLVVCDGGRGAIGVVTRTDAMRHVGENANPLVARIAELMTSNVVAARPFDDLLATWQMMTRCRLNHLPVLDHRDRPVGVLTADDALAALLEIERYEEHLLADYVAGIGYR
jgi:CBS domain-containing protein